MGQNDSINPPMQNRDWLPGDRYGGRMAQNRGQMGAALPQPNDGIGSTSQALNLTSDDGSVSVNTSGSGLTDDNGVSSGAAYEADRRAAGAGATSQQAGYLAQRGSHPTASVAETGYGPTLPAHLGGGPNPNHNPTLQGSGLGAPIPGAPAFNEGGIGGAPPPMAQAFDGSYISDPASRGFAESGGNKGRYVHNAATGRGSEVNMPGTNRYADSDMSPEAQFWRQGRQQDYQRDHGAGNGQRYYGRDHGVQGKGYTGGGNGGT